MININNELLIYPESMDYDDAVDFLKEVERQKFDYIFRTEMIKKYNINENNQEKLFSIIKNIENFVGKNTRFLPMSMVDYWFGFVQLENQIIEKKLEIDREKENYLWEHCGLQLFKEAEERKMIRNRRARKLNAMMRTGCALSIALLILMLILEFVFKGSSFFTFISFLSIVLILFLPWVSIGIWIYSNINPDAFVIVPENLETLRKIPEMNERLRDFELQDSHMLNMDEKVVDLENILAKERFDNCEIYTASSLVLRYVIQFEALSEIKSHISMNPFDVKELNYHDQLVYHKGKALQKFNEQRHQEKLHNEHMRALERKTDAINAQTKIIEEFNKRNAMHIKNK